MTEEQLQEHGYPRSNPEAPGRAVLYNLPEKKPASDREPPHSLWYPCCSCSLLTLAAFTAFSKICCRCGAEYKVNANGNCVRKEECSFHWGQLRRHKGPSLCLFLSIFVPILQRIPPRRSPAPSPCPTVAGGWETSYRCCAAAVGAPGCQVSKVLHLLTLQPRGDLLDWNLKQRTLSPTATRSGRTQGLLRGIRHHVQQRSPSGWKRRGLCSGL